MVVRVDGPTTIPVQDVQQIALCIQKVLRTLALVGAMAAVGTRGLGCHRATFAAAEWAAPG